VAQEPDVALEQRLAAEAQQDLRRKRGIAEAPAEAGREYSSPHSLFLRSTPATIYARHRSTPATIYAPAHAAAVESQARESRFQARTSMERGRRTRKGDEVLSGRTVARDDKAGMIC
jgi:hypothetical protein